MLLIALFKRYLKEKSLYNNKCIYMYIRIYSKILFIPTPVDMLPFDFQSDRCHHLAE